MAFGNCEAGQLRSSTARATACSRTLGLAATRASMRLCGTLEYLAPEQLRGKTYGRSVDLWALGCLTFETLVGYSPFSAARTRIVFEGILQARALLRRVR